MSDNDFPEIRAMEIIAKTLLPLNEEARQLALSWANERFGKGKKKPLDPTAQSKDAMYTSLKKSLEAPPEVREHIEYSEEGGFQCHFNDLKAKSKRDAVNRLSHILLFAHEKLTGNKELNRHALTTTLEEWRLYDGNARYFITNHRGLRSKGIGKAQKLSLDKLAREDAKRYLREVLDPNLKGSWDPSKESRVKKSSRSGDIRE